MSDEAAVDAHYTRGNLFEAIAAALTAAGKDLAQLTVGDLAPLDHFHGRGAAATAELAAGLEIAAGHHLLDIGCGIGGPARHMAAKFGCRVTGIDLTQVFCEVARRLTALVGLEVQVSIEQASALALPFGDAVFDGAYSQYVSMNIADKAGFYGEAWRVLKPGGRLALAELALGEAGDPVYPTPWSDDGTASFLQTAEQTAAALRAAGFEIISLEDKTPAALEAYRRQREEIAREGPPKLGVHVIMGASAKAKLRNAAQNVEEGRTRPIDIICRKV